MMYIEKTERKMPRIVIILESGLIKNIERPFSNRLILNKEEMIVICPELVKIASNV